MLWDVSTATPVARLEGHQYQVTSVVVSPSGHVISSSLDGTIRVWKATVDTASSASASDNNNNNMEMMTCVHVLQGHHEGAVLSLLLLPSGDLLSGGGDQTIRVWKGLLSASDRRGGSETTTAEVTCAATIQAHSDSVRSLALLPHSLGVVSASHDMSLKVWTLDAEPLAELVGHTALVYSVAACDPSSPKSNSNIADDGGGGGPSSSNAANSTADGVGVLIASGSEDNTARLWHIDGSCLQAIEHPGNIWDVAFLENGDVVTACSDGVARVWTTSAQRRAGPDVVAGYEAGMNARKEAAAGASGNGAGGDGAAAGGLPGGLKIQDPSILQTPGAKDGQTVVVREGGAGVAYSWNTTAAKWERIGEVVGASNTLKKSYLGLEYDFVFDVDVAEGAPPLKLPLNVGDNPYAVAEKFIFDNNLPTTYQEQIVQFIIQNTGGAVQPPPIGGGGGFVDPFTGANAYVPPPPVSGIMSNGGGGAPSSSAATATMATTTATGGGVDPYTGSQSSVKKCIPARHYLLYDTPLINGAAVKKKILEFNDQLSEEQFKFQGNDEVSLLSLIDSVAQQQQQWSDGGLHVLKKMISSWPVENVFPALDIARLAVLNPEATGKLLLKDNSMKLDICSVIAAASAADAPMASQLTAMKFLANLTASFTAVQWVQSSASSLLDAIGPLASVGAKKVRLALAAVLFNLAVMLSKLPSDELETKFKLIGVAIKLMETVVADNNNNNNNNDDDDDVEMCWRAIVAAGSPLDHSKVRAAGREMGLHNSAAKCAGNMGVGKVGSAAQELEVLIRL